MKVAIPEDVVFRELGGEMVLLNLATGTYFGLNEVGSRMWALLVENRTSDRVLEEISKEYDAPADQLRRDLDAWMKRLLEKGLIRVEG